MKIQLFHSSFQDTLSKCEGRADLIFTSPPYCDARTYGNEVSWGMEEYAELGDLIFAALKPGGNCLFNVDAPVREWREGFGSERGFHPWKIMLDWAERVGFRVPDRLAYGRLGCPGAYTGRFRNDWEPLLWFQKPGGDSYFNKNAIAKPSSDTNFGPSSSRRRDGTMYTRKRSGWAVENGKIQRGTFWDYGLIGGSPSRYRQLLLLDHPASFTYDLAEDVVNCFAPPNGLICDPFLGSGTTAVAALNAKCSFIGGDLYHHQDGLPWVVKVGEILQEMVDPGVLGLFQHVDAPTIEVHTCNP